MEAKKNNLNGWSAAEVAKKVGCSRATVYNWCNGKESYFANQIKSIIKTPKIKGMIEITDIDRQIDNDGEFGIEVNNRWRRVDAADFFSWLYNTGQIDGHDPEREMAWNFGDGYYCQRRDVYIDGAAVTRSYDSWLIDITDEEYARYIASCMALESV